MKSVKERRMKHVIRRLKDHYIICGAGIETASGLVAALPDDQSNLFVVLTARQLNKDLHIVTQATSYNTIQQVDESRCRLPAGAWLPLSFGHPWLICLI